MNLCSDSFGGVILGSIRGNSGVIPGSFCGHSGVNPGSFRDHSGVIPGSFQDRFGIIPESFRDHSGVVLGSFWGHFGIIPGFAVWIQRRFGASRNKSQRQLAPVADAGTLFSLKEPSSETLLGKNRSCQLVWPASVSEAT